MVNLRLGMLNIKVPDGASPVQHRWSENSKDTYLWGSCSALQCPLKECLEGDFIFPMHVWVCGYACTCVCVCVCVCVIET